MEIVIIGIISHTEEAFRPSDWAHRLAGHFSCPDGKICRYDQEVRIYRDDNNAQCFSLKNPSDEAHAYLHWFASLNDLIIYDI